MTKIGFLNHIMARSKFQFAFNPDKLQHLGVEFCTCINNDTALVASFDTGGIPKNPDLR